MTIQYSVAVRNARLNAIETEIGTTPLIEIRTGAPPADCATAATGNVLVQQALPSDWLAAAASGAKAIGSGPWALTALTNIATSNAGYFRIHRTGSPSVCDMQGTITATGGGACVPDGLIALKARQEMFATPTTMDSLPPKSPEALDREATIARPGRSKPANLRDQVSNIQMWPTPHANCHIGAGEHGVGGMNLQTAVRLLPTPSAGDYKGSSKDGQRRGQLTDPAMGVIPASGRLNPRFVEWLMNWPLGWTNTKNFKAGGKSSHKLEELPTKPEIGRRS